MASEDNSKRERELIRKRAAFKTKVTTFARSLESFSDITLGDVNHLKNRLDKLESDYEAFDLVQDELETIASDDMFETRLAERAEFDEKHHKVARKVQTIIAMSEQVNQSQKEQDHPSVTSRPNTVANPVETASSPSWTVPSEVHVKLPTMDLPKFSGSYETWPGFCDAFRSAIHDNPNFRDSQKLIYLRSCLTGKAAEKIESLSTTAANYLVAWDLLERSYNDPTAIIYNRVKALFELPTCTRVSATSVGEILDCASKHYRALQATNHPFLEAFPIYAVVAKLDVQTRLRWKERIQGNPFPTMDELLEFLRIRHKVLENSQFDRTFDRAERPQPHKRAVETNRSTFACPTSNLACHICKESHYTYQCPKLTKVAVEQRYEVIKQAGLCRNCLRPNHTAKQCTAGTCKQCKAKHHTLLHRETNTNQQTDRANVVSLTTTTPFEVILSNAIVEVLDKDNKPRPCRVLLDSGSQSNFLTESFATNLGLNRDNIKLPVVGINQTTSQIHHMVKSRIKSRINTFSTELTFLILPRITESLPSQAIPKRQLQLPANLPLADPAFCSPSEIDGLLGVEIFYKLLCVGQIAIANNQLTLQKTKLGWIVAGKLKFPRNSKASICNISLHPLQSELDRFWEIEEGPHKKLLSHEESACEQHYQQHTTRDSSSGQYTVRLPFKENPTSLGDSHSIALKRFYSLERSLAKNPENRLNYTEFMKEYHLLGHMSKLDAVNTKEGYYLPHHAVVKQSSVTTKLRVVFDASAKTSNGISLNQTLMTGPTIQDDLYSILLRFRCHAYVLTADIEKMYRQIVVHPQDRKYQRILWRDNPQAPIDTYALNTVTYGTSAAPFLAIRSLQQLAKDESTQLPRAAAVLREDFYVDDLLTGTRTFDEAERIRDEIITICRRGGLQLRQWASNDERLLYQLDKTENTHIRLDLDETVKTLGIQWNARQDIITYTVTDMTPTQRITKRTVLSKIASLFDPLGLLGPVVIQAKLLMQSLWQLRVDWDESLPVDIHTRWIEYCKEFQSLRNVQFERQATIRHYSSAQVHGFCDASQRAYGACIYIRSSREDGTIITRLLCSKSRVAPLKTISLPRLELCAAHLLAKLYKSILIALPKLTFENATFWSDSTITLHWLRTPPHKLKTFVAHRVAEIQAITTNYHWRHVPSESNPADLISRGIKPRDIQQNNLWHYGPTWLTNSGVSWPNLTLEPIELPDTRPLITCIARVTHWDVLAKFSSFRRLKRVFAYCFRFITNTSRRETLTGPLSARELQIAEMRIIRTVQREGFAREIDSLVSKPPSMNFLTLLNPFIDKDGILRVGGRLSHAMLPYNSKHPILIPKNHSVTRAIVRDEHLRNFHAGTLATLNSLRQKYWIPSGKPLVKQIIHKCITCHRAKPAIPTYIMGNLPKGRLIQARPFLHTGVDYCGPLFIKEKVNRNRSKVKVYLAIFVCLSTKAIHIEIVNDLTTEAFLATLRRFFARRGKCSDLYSDNATTFIGAKREVKELYAMIKTQSYNDVISEALGNDGINWHLIPPRAPHFGGLWEAAVKSTKYHIVRIIGDTLLSYEALLTYINQIEAILNSRPITPLSSDPNDLRALTPSHFLIGEVLTSMPDHALSTTPTGRLSMWQHVQQLQQHFWTRWVKEYLQEQTVQKKWHANNPTNIKEGELVILREDNLPPSSWPLGRIVALHPDNTGLEGSRRFRGTRAREFCARLEAKEKTIGKSH